MLEPVPPGDILIHSGDFTNYGRKEEVEKFNQWLGTLPHRWWRRTVNQLWLLFPFQTQDCDSREPWDHIWQKIIWQSLCQEKSFWWKLWSSWLGGWWHRHIRWEVVIPRCLNFPTLPRYSPTVHTWRTRVLRWIDYSRGSIWVAIFRWKV